MQAIKGGGYGTELPPKKIIAVQFSRKNVGLLLAEDIVKNV